MESLDKNSQIWFAKSGPEVIFVEIVPKMAEKMQDAPIVDVIKQEGTHFLPWSVMLLCYANVVNIYSQKSEFRNIFNDLSTLTAVLNLHLIKVVISAEVHVGTCY